MKVQLPQDIKKLGTIMGIWAHPDDETYSMAGIMATAVKNGQKVICVTATRGEQGVQDESRWPQAQLATVRSQEIAAALAILGVDEHVWLDYPDGKCATVDQKIAVDKITQLIHQYQPTSLFTFGPDGLTGHSDHRTVSAWTRLARAQAKSGAPLYFAIQTSQQYKHMQKADKDLNIFFNIKKPPIQKDCDCDICYGLPTDIYMQKLAALRCMPSQTEAMLLRYNAILPQAIGTEAFKHAY